MQKHRQSGRTERKRKRFNANFRIGQSNANAIKGILGFLDGQESFASDYLRSEYLSKYCSEDLVPASQRRLAAVKKWLSQEEENSRTNSRVRGMDRGFNILPRVTFYRFLEFAQRVVSEVLGPLTNEVTLGSFSGGASTSRRRFESHPALKFLGMADCTTEAIPLVDVIHRQSELFRQYNVFYSLNEVDGAVLFTVPKKSDIDRCACKEPDVNMYLQKGVGRHIRRRLLRFGINLNDQSINRDLARRGSLLGDLATLDLSSASDSITTAVVQALLPTDWFLYLNDIRSQNVVVDGRTIRTEMFSSMGNGFTFELESLLFYALMRSVSYFENIRGIISVYGDDIIIPVGMYDAASWVLGEFGFSLNHSKSFAAGPFRESCGGHYHLGVDVTPFYLKREPTHLTDVIRVANQIRRWTLSEPGREHEMPATYDMWHSLASMVPKALWGGYDMSLDTQLVSAGPCSSRLVRKESGRKIPDLGRYLDWHNTNRDRSWEAIDSFPAVNTTNHCFTRAAKPGAPASRPLFYKELEPFAGVTDR